MLRKLIFVVSALAFTLSSCGRQVTPDRTGTSASGLQPGYMQIKFNTAGTMDFTNVWYVIALNTSGTGTEPYAINGNQQQNWLDYSFEIIVFQGQGQIAPQAELIQFLTQPNPGGGTVKVPSAPFTVAQQQLQLNPNCNGSQTQFCVTIDRHLFSGLNGSAPSASPSSSPSATPSTSPSASPSGSPSASPTPGAFSGVVYVNWFTVNPSGAVAAGGQVIDAPGLGGATDHSWLPENPPSHNYDTSRTFDYPWNAVPGWTPVSSAAAQIAGGEVLNSP